VGRFEQLDEERTPVPRPGSGPAQPVVVQWFKPSGSAGPAPVGIGMGYRKPAPSTSVASASANMAASGSVGRSMSAPGTPPRAGTPNRVQTMSPSPSFSSYSPSLGQGAVQGQGQRRPPIPPAAYSRYTALFERNLLSSSSASSAGKAKTGSQMSSSSSSSSVGSIATASTSDTASTTATSSSGGTALPPRKDRSSSGWRGTSIDGFSAIALGGSAGAGESGWESGDAQGDKVGKLGQGGNQDEGKLKGYVVKAIWSLSKLPREKLQEIWKECDTDHSGALDREQFARGMWRIDEELRRARERGAGGGGGGGSRLIKSRR